MLNITLPARDAGQLTIKPTTPWLFHQRWQNVIFFHWKADADGLEKYIPPDAEPDFFDNSAWLSLVLFAVKNNHLRKMSSLRIPPDFYEINLRTYITCKGVPGICFLDMKASSLLAVLMNRFLRLPSKTGSFSRIQKQGTEDTFYHLGDLNYINTKYKTGRPLVKTEKDIWLTERHVAFQYLNGNTFAYSIQHKPLHLHKMDINSVDVYWRFKALHLTNLDIDCMHFAPAADVHLWYPKRFN